MVIYFDEKPVYLCDELDENLHELIHHSDVVFVDEFSSRAINSLLHEMKKESIHAGIMWYKDLEKLKKSFLKHFTCIEASGGIVQNEAKDILFIFRRGYWDLPKGKLEKNESLELCAEREIEEETGITNLKYKELIGTTYHAYDEYGKHFIKISHWFYFTCKGKNEGKPQAEEDITEVKWFPTKDIKIPMANTHPNIKDILGRFFEKP